MPAPQIDIESRLPEERYPSTEDVIERFAPNEPGVVFFWDKAGHFWFAAQTEDKAILLSIRSDPSDSRRQATEFAFEVWFNPKDCDARWRYVVDRLKPTGQRVLRMKV